MNIQSESISFDRIWFLRLKILLPVLAFSIPFLLSGPQFLTGTIVNTLLYISTSKQIKQRSLYLISLLPGLGAISNGVLFGKFTPYLLFFIPSIWLGNIILIKSFSNLKNVVSFPLVIIFPSILKTTFLYISALILVNAHFVPNIFISSMGIIQLFTSLMGGALAYTLLKFKDKQI